MHGVNKLEDGDNVIVMMIMIMITIRRTRKRM